MTREDLNVAVGYDFNEEQFAKLVEVYNNAGILETDFSNIVRMTLEFAEASIENDANAKLAQYLIRRSVEDNNKQMARVAIDLIGYRKFLAYKLRSSLKLYPADVEYIANSLVDLGGNETLAEMLEREE